MRGASANSRAPPPQRIAIWQFQELTKTKATGWVDMPRAITELLNKHTDEMKCVAYYKIHDRHFVADVRAKRQWTTYPQRTGSTAIRCIHVVPKDVVEAPFDKLEVDVTTAPFATEEEDKNTWTDTWTTTLAGQMAACARRMAA